MSAHQQGLTIHGALVSIKLRHVEILSSNLVMGGSSGESGDEDEQRFDTEHPAKEFRESQGSGPWTSQKFAGLCAVGLTLTRRKA